MNVVLMIEQPQALLLLAYILLLLKYIHHAQAH